MADRLDFIVDGKSSGFVGAVNTATHGADRFDESLESLTNKQVRYNAEANRFIDASGNFISGTKAREVITRRLADASDEAGAAIQDTGKRSGAAFGPVQQLGFMINDLQSFSYGAAAGVRAISNNIGVMAIGMGLGSAAIVALNVGMSAIALFADQLFRGAKNANEMKKAMEGLIEVTSNFQKFQEDVTGLAGTIRDLEEGIRVAENERLKLTGLRKDLITEEETKRVRLLEMQIKRAKDLRGVLRGQLDDYNMQVQASNFLKEMGVDIKVNQEDIEGLVDDTRMGAEETEIAYSQIEQAQHRIQKQIEAAKNAEERRKLAIVAARLEREKEGAVIARTAGLLGMRGLGGMPGGIIGQRRRASGTTFAGVDSGQLRTMGDGVVSEMQSLNQRITEENRNLVSNFVGFGFEFGDAIESGLAQATTALASGAANFEQAFGGFLVNLGEGLIAQGFGGLAIKAFVANPVGAIIAGGALVAAGSALAKSSQEKANQFASGQRGLGSGGTSSFTGGSAFVPQAFTARNPPPQRVIVEVRGTVRGEDLRLVQRRIEERHAIAGRS